MKKSAHSSRSARVIKRAAAGAVWIAATLPSSMPAEAQPQVEATPLSRLVDTDLPATLGGEADTLSIPFNLPSGAKDKPAVLKLAYENAVHILPDLSHFKVALNGLELGDLPLTAFEKPVSASIDMPPGYLKAGRNELTINYTARHRVSCGVESTFEMWARPLLDRSSLEVLDQDGSATPLLQDAATLLAMTSPTGRGLTILNAKPDGGTAQLPWGAGIAQGVALRAGDRAITPKTGTPAVQRPDGDRLLPGLDKSALGDGRNVLIGDADQLGAIVGDRIRTAITGPYLGLFKVGDEGAMVLVVSGRTADEVTTATQAFANPAVTLPAAAEMIVSEAHAAPVPELATFPSGRAVALSELGYKTREFNGYRFSQRLAVTLGRDFFNLDSRKAILRINAASAPGIGTGAALSVFVNGGGAAAMPLSRDGAIIERRDLHLPMSLFRPGHNEILITADLPPADGANCIPEQQISPRFSLFSDSTLTLPEYARLSQFPDLGTFARTGSPYTDGGADAFDVVLMNRSADEVAAAWALLAKLAQASGHPLAPRFVQPGATMPAGDALIVGNHRTLARLPGVELPVKPAEMTAAWGIGLDTSPSPDPASPVNDDTSQLLAQIEAMRAAGQSSGETEAPAGDGDVRNRWQKIVKSGEKQSVVTSVSEAAEDAVTSMRRHFPAVFGQTKPAEVGLFSGGGPVPSGLLMQMESTVTPSRTWTILTAGGDGLLAESAALLVRRPYWDRLSGAATVWGPDPAATRSTEPATTYHRFDTDLRVSNLRLIAGNLMSEHVLWWTAGLLVLVAAFGLVTRSFLGNEQKSGHD